MQRGRRYTEKELGGMSVEDLQQHLVCELCTPVEELEKILKIL